MQEAGEVVQLVVTKLGHQADNLSSMPRTNKCTRKDYGPQPCAYREGVKGSGTKDKMSQASKKMYTGNSTSTYLLLILNFHFF